MSNLQAVKNYYDDLATEYDQDRFGGSYGHYLHRQEVVILKNWLSGISPNDVLELGCGTGRFSSFAKTGVDFSSGMLSVARKNFPENKYHEADIRGTGLPPAKFQAIICLHVLMHLEKGMFPEIWQEAHRLLHPGGVFIFDVPSTERRNLTGHRQANWHGGTSLSGTEVDQLNFKIFSREKSDGVLHLPVHRFPNSVRGLFQPLDNLMGKTKLNRWASYRFFMLRKI